MKLPDYMRREIERQVVSLENQDGMRLNDAKERPILPGGTLRRVLAALDERVSVPEGMCAWVQIEDGCDRWETSCRHTFDLNDGTPADNGMKYCCYCGKSLEEVPFSAPESDEAD